MKKNIQIVILIFCSVFLLSKSYSQKIRRCGTYQIDSIANLNNPDRIKNKAAFEQSIQNYLANKRFSGNERIAATNDVIKIPVVVHVIHNNTQGTIGGANNTNISDEQIASQIQVLNEDYRKIINTFGYNTNPIGADTQIEFFLAKRNPDGTASTGITRNYYARTTFNISTDLNNIGNGTAWDPNRYLNIWVLPLSGGYLGITPTFNWDFALGSSEIADGDSTTDGVFIHYQAFGRQIGTANANFGKGLYTLGRTATHEIGHFFGLIHTWGDVNCGTDYCDDTPTARTSNDTPYCKDVYSTCNGVRTLNMIQNYLDYSPDSCMNIFTNDQVSRMKAVIELSPRRHRLIAYAKSLELPISDKLSVTVLGNPVVTDLTLRVLFKNFQTFQVDIYDERGIKVYNQAYYDVPSSIITIKNLGLTAGNYLVKVSTASESQVSRIFFTK